MKKLTNSFANRERKDLFVRVILILRQEYVIIGAAFAGAFLRTYQIERQILTGDEWHALHIALYSPGYLNILSSFGGGSHSIPEALYYKLLIDTIGLSEFNMHIPHLFAGIFTIIIIPVLVREIIGRYAANLLAWLLALSPFLIFYSRFARPYGIIVLLCFSGVVLFYKWWMTGNRYYAIAGSVSSLLSIYFHIISLPFVLGSYVYFLVLILLEKKGRRLNSIKRLFKIGLATFMPLAVLIGAPMFFSHGAITDKTGALAISFNSVLQACWLLLGGIDSTSFVAGIVIMISAGLFVNIFRGHDRRRFFLYLIFLSLVQIFFVVVSKPVAGNGPHIFARYIILIEPALLIFLASGIETFLGFLNIRLFIQIFLITVFLSLTLLKGPVLYSISHHNNASNLFLLGNMILGKDFQDIAVSKTIKRVPVFYKKAAMFPSNTLTIVEAPYHFNGHHVLFYQLVHRQSILMGFIDGLCSENRVDETPYSFNGIRFKNFIFLKDPQLLHDRGVDFAVFHKHLSNEIYDKPIYSHQDVSFCIEQYRAWFGVPEFEDQDIVVFSVKPQLTGRRNGQ